MLTINTQASEALKTPWELPLTDSPLDKPAATHSEETSTSPKETVNPTVVQPEAEAETSDNSHENPGTEIMVEEAPPDPTSKPAAPQSDINTREAVGEPAVESAAPADTAPQGDAPAAGNEKTPENDEENGFVTGFPLTCLFVGLMLGVFLVSLDRTIISTVRMTRVVHSPISARHVDQYSPHRPSRTSPTNFTRRRILDGMARPTFSQLVLSSPCLVGFSCCSRSKRHTSLAWRSLSLAR